MESSLTGENSYSEAGGHVDDTVSIPKGHGKIIRDSDGNVIRIEFGVNESSQDMESLEPQIASSILNQWAGRSSGGPASMASRNVIKGEFFPIVLVSYESL